MVFDFKFIVVFIFLVIFGVYFKDELVNIGNFNL